MVSSIIIYFSTINVPWMFISIKIYIQKTYEVQILLLGVYYVS